MERESEKPFEIPNEFLSTEFNPFAYIDYRLTALGEVSTVPLSRGEFISENPDQNNSDLSGKIDPSDVVVLVRPEQIQSFLQGLSQELRNLRRSISDSAKRHTLKCDELATSFLKKSENVMKDLDVLNSQTKGVVDTIEKSTETTTRRADRLEMLHCELKEATEASIVCTYFQELNKTGVNNEENDQEMNDSDNLNGSSSSSSSSFEEIAASTTSTTSSSSSSSSSSSFEQTSGSGPKKQQTPLEVACKELERENLEKIEELHLPLTVEENDEDRNGFHSYLDISIEGAKILEHTHTLSQRFTSTELFNGKSNINKIFSKIEQTFNQSLSNLGKKDDYGEGGETKEKEGKGKGDKDSTKNLGFKESVQNNLRSVDSTINELQKIITTLFAFGTDQQKVISNFISQQWMNVDVYKMRELANKAADKGQLVWVMDELFTSLQIYFEKERQIISKIFRSQEDEVLKLTLTRVITEVSQHFVNEFDFTVLSKLKSLSEMHSKYLNYLRKQQEKGEGEDEKVMDPFAAASRSGSRYDDSEVRSITSFNPPNVVFSWVDGIFDLFEGSSSFVHGICTRYKISDYKFFIKDSFSSQRERYIFEECKAINLYFAILLNIPISYIFTFKGSVAHVEGNFPYLSKEFISYLADQHKQYSELRGNQRDASQLLGRKGFGSAGAGISGGRGNMSFGDGKGQSSSLLSGTLFGSGSKSQTSTPKERGGGGDGSDSALQLVGGYTSTPLKRTGKRGDSGGSGSGVYGSGSSSKSALTTPTRGPTRRQGGTAPNQPSHLSSSSQVGDDDEDNDRGSESGRDDESEDDSAQMNGWVPEGMHPLQVGLSCLPRCIIRGAVLPVKSVRVNALMQFFEVAFAWCVTICSKWLEDAQQKNLMTAPTESMTISLKGKGAEEIGEELMDGQQRKQDENIIKGDSLKDIGQVTSVVGMVKSVWNVHFSHLLEHDAEKHKEMKKHIKNQLNGLESIISNSIHSFLLATLRQFIRILKDKQNLWDYDPESESKIRAELGDNSLTPSSKSGATSRSQMGGAMNKSFMFTQPTDACTEAINFLTTQFNTITNYIGEMNAYNAMVELSLAVCDAIISHILSFSVKDEGTNRLNADISQYQYFFNRLDNNAVRAAFDMLKELVTVHFVEAERLKEYIDNSAKDPERRKLFLEFVKARSDYTKGKLWKKFPELSEK